MRIPLTAFVVITFLLLSSGMILPSRAQSQPEMTAQAWSDFAEADKRLNVVYQKVLKSMDDEVARQKLIAAQKAWIAFRDAEAEVDADAERGGSLAPQLRAMSCTATTEARIVQLKKLADQ